MSTETAVNVTKIIKDIKLTLNKDSEKITRTEPTEEKSTKYGKRHFCEICGKGFAKRCGLKTHHLIHEGVKPFSCEICSKTFTKKCTLTVHLMTHSTDRPFECDLCDKSFARKSDLKKHSFIHSGEKPHICNICGRGFSRRNTLRKHELTHFPKKPKTPQPILKIIEDSLESSALECNTSSEFTESVLSNNTFIDESFATESNLSSIHELNEIDIYEDNLDVLSPFLANGLDKEFLSNELENDLYKDLSQMDDLMLEYSMENISFNESMLMCDTESYSVSLVDNSLKETKEDLLLEAEKASSNKDKVSVEDKEMVASVPVLEIQSLNEKNMSLCNLQRKHKGSVVKNKMIDKVAKTQKTLDDTVKKSSEIIENQIDILTNSSDETNSTDSTLNDINGIFNVSSNLNTEVTKVKNSPSLPTFFNSFHTIVPCKNLSDSFPMKNIQTENCVNTSLSNEDCALTYNLNEASILNNIIDNTTENINLAHETTEESSHIGNISCNSLNIDELKSELFAASSSVAKISPNDLIDFENLENKVNYKIKSKKSFSCDKCNKSFTKNCTLKTHLLIHEGIKPFSCNICKKSFTKKCTLTGHLLTHETKRPHVCNICQKAFLRQNDLKKHSFVHAEVKPHICKLCGKGYTQQTKLRKHHIMHHPGEPLITVNTKSSLKSTSSDLTVIKSKENSTTSSQNLIYNLLSNKAPENHTSTKPETQTFKIILISDTDKKLGKLTVHTDKKIYSCLYCSASFPSQHLLQIHSMTHIKIPLESIDMLSGNLKQAGEDLDLKDLITGNCYNISSKIQSNSIIEACASNSDSKLLSSSTCSELYVNKDSVIKSSNKNNKEISYCIKDLELRISNASKSNLIASSEKSKDNLKNTTSENPDELSENSSCCSSMLSDGIDQRVPDADISIKKSSSSSVNSKSLVNPQSNSVGNVKKHVCHICDKTYASKSSLKAHISLHANVKPYICEICYTTFAKKSSLTIHSFIHTGERPHVCPTCKKCFTRKYDLQKHNLTHTGEKPYVCDVCNAKFNHQNNLKRHKRIHTGEKPHVCKICRKSFSEVSLLLTHSKQHIKEAELNNSIDECLKSVKDKLHKCDICGTGFARRDRLVRHKLTHEAAATVYSCNTCNHSFKNKEQLQSHLLIHADISLDDIADNVDVLEDLDLTKLEPTVQDINKTFPCDLCVKVFSSKKALKNHLFTHTGEKPHQCNLCNKCFSQRITLKRHMVVHTGERPYMCNMCQKTFTRKTSLRKHIIIHSQKNLF